MSHERGPRISGSEGTPSARDYGVVQRLKRHLLEWPRRYVEMRVDAIEDRSS